jgi:hypothetical protein
MGNLHHLSGRRGLFLDERGHGLQMAWGPSRGHRRQYLA